MLSTSNRISCTPGTKAILVCKIYFDPNPNPNLYILGKAVLMEKF